MSPSSDLAAQYVQVEVASPEDQQFIVYTEWNIVSQLEANVNKNLKNNHPESTYKKENTHKKEASSDLSLCRELLE